MRRAGWKTTNEVLRLFQAVGRASLSYDIQDSHSGNMALKILGSDGRERIVITATGSQKGDLDAGQICFLSAAETDFGYYKASSETDIHARILSLEGVGASIHAHTKDLAVMTFDDEPKPNAPKPFVPLDPLGFHHLKEMIPVDWVQVPSGSAEMVEKITARLAAHPATVIQTHGTFARGRTLQEAFFRVCLANNSGYVVRLMERLGVDPEELRRKLRTDPKRFFAGEPEPYTVGDDEVRDFKEEEEIQSEFLKTGARIFESRLSPFHTGSLSVRGVRDMLYAPKASMPREIGGPLRRLPLSPGASDSGEVKRHKALYAAGDFQSVLHCYVPEAEAHARYVPPNADAPADRIVPIDAEGSFLYLVIPVVPPETREDELIRLLHDYNMVVVRGGGVWAVGAYSLSEVLHHPSSLREICLYRIGVQERGLDPAKMEPKKAKTW